MTKQKCQAKNPATCRFHGKRVYEQTLKDIEYWYRRASEATTSEEFAMFNAKRREAEVARDASAVGFALLTNKLKRSLKTGDVYMQSGFASRLAKASKLRLDDGQVSDWEKSKDDSVFFAQKILASAKTSNVVGTPIELSGAHDVGRLYDQLKTFGYKVTEFEVYPFYSSTSDEPAAASEMNKKALDWADKAGGTTVFEKVLEPAGYAMRGLTFTNSDGRSIKVTEDRTIEKK